MALPAPLIPPLRAALQSQGFPANSVTDAGVIDPAALLSGVFSSVEIRTELTPPVVVKTAALGGESSPFVKFLKPTVVLTGPTGRTTIAPHGPATGGWLGAVALVGGLVGAGFLLGRMKK